MKKVFFLILFSLKVTAALPPDVQNEIDIDAMMNFARQDRDVMFGLKSVNLEDYTVTYVNFESKNCVATFVRGPSPSEPEPGPARPLVLSGIRCQ